MKTRILLALLALTFAAPASRAAIIQYDFSGTITDVLDPYGHHGGAFAVGMPMSGTLRYDPATPNSSTNPVTKTYVHDPSSADIGLSITLGDFSYETDLEFKINLNTIVFQAISKGATGTGPGADEPFSFLEFFLSTQPDPFFDPSQLPTELDLGDFKTAGIYLTDLNRLPGAGVVADISSLSMVANPEPGTALLVAAGLTVLGVRGRRRAA